MSTPPAAMALDEVLVSPQFVIDPHPIFRRLRVEDPVYWSESIGGWILTRYEDIMVTFRETRAYSNEGRLVRASAYLPAATRAKLTAFEDHYKTKGLLHSDPPDHTRLRKLFLTAFTPRVVDSMRPRIQQVVDGLLDAVQARGRMEVIQELAFALPVTVLCDILGVPHSDTLKFKFWADRLLAFQGVNRPDEKLLLDAQGTLIECRAYLAAMIKKARGGHGGEGLIGKMVAAEADGGKLTENEIINTCVTLLVAGHETTTSLIGNGLVCLLSHPDQWELLKSNRSLLAPAIEEILRYESPVARQPRLMKQDATLGGKSIKQGQMVFQMLAAANRDPEIFDDPDRFNILREDNKHIAFGYGAHYCIGASLSRMEGQVVFTTLMDRMPNLKMVDPEAHWDPTKPNSRVLEHLHVMF